MNLRRAAGRLVRQWSVRILWEPRDLRVGIYWNRSLAPGCFDYDVTNIYVCLVPCLPVRFTRVVTALEAGR